MTDLPSQNQSFQESLVSLEPLVPEKYEEYRMNLESAIDRTIARRTLTTYICIVSLILSFVLMFVGGSKVLGSFDPTETRATPISIVLGVIYALSSITWPITLAMIVSRFNPRLRSLRERLILQTLEDLRSRIAKLEAQSGDSSPR